MSNDNDSTYFIEGDNGEPLGVINTNVIGDAGWLFAIRTAAHCDDVVAMDAIAADTLTSVGVESFGYVAASGFRYLAQEILSPVLAAGEVAGVHMRDGLLALSRGENPATEFAAELQQPPSRANTARAVLAEDASAGDVVSPVHPEAEDLFEPLKTFTVPQVYHRPTDHWRDVPVTAGWNPASGETVLVGEHEFTKEEAEQVAARLLDAVRFLDGYFVYEGEVS